MRMGSGIATSAMFKQIVSPHLRGFISRQLDYHALLIPQRAATPSTVVLVLGVEAAPRPVRKKKSESHADEVPDRALEQRATPRWSEDKNARWIHDVQSPYRRGLVNEDAPW